MYILILDEAKESVLSCGISNICKLVWRRQVLANVYIDFQTGQLHDYEVLLRPQRQKVFKYAHALLAETIHLNPGVNLTFRE